MKSMDNFHMPTAISQISLGHEIQQGCGWRLWELNESMIMSISWRDFEIVLYWFVWKIFLFFYKGKRITASLLSVSFHKNKSNYIIYENGSMGWRKAFIH